MFRLLFLLSGLLLPNQAVQGATIAEHHELRLASGRELQVELRLPSQSKAHSLPAVLLFGGFETGARAADLLGPKLPFLLATFQYPFEPQRKLGLSKALKLLPEARRAVRDTIAGIPALVDYLKTRPEVDPNRIIFVGASFGAPFVSIVAPDRPDARGIILAHGFGDIPGTIAFRLEAEWGHGLLSAWAAAFAAKFLWWYADVPAPEKKLRELGPRQKVLLMTADNDEMLPKKSVDVLREALRASKASWKEKSFPGTHLRPDEKELIKKLLAESERWMREEGLMN